MRKFILLFSILYVSFGHSVDYPLSDLRVSFEEGMSPSDNYSKSFSETDWSWLLAKNLYENYIMKDLIFAEEPRIPLIIHHVWLGSPLPEYVKNFRKTWIENHPSWTHILWTNYPNGDYGNVVLESFDELKLYLQNPEKEHLIVMDVSKIEFYNQTAYKKGRNYGEKSDIIRYEILLQIGGLYVDTDFECVRPFDDFHYSCDFFSGIAFDKDFCLFNGLIGSAPNCSVLKDAVLRLKGRPQLKTTLAYSGPFYFTNCFLNAAVSSTERLVAFPLTYFYPWHPRYRYSDSKEAKFFLRKESYALHYWKVSWL